MIALMPARQRGRVIGVPIDVVSWPEAVSRLMGWAGLRQSRYVCICNVHSVVSATTDTRFREVVEASDMATPDGAPVAWTLRAKGFRGQARISGPDLMWRLCGEAENQGVPIGLFGSTDATLNLLKMALAQAFPALKVVYCVSPPFRELSAAEDAEICQRINDSGAGLLFVGLGCPKQEKWMAIHRGRVNAVMLGVGAAFDFHAGTVARAPAWMRSSGLEWLHRLLSEPRRLWRRYLVTNVLFIVKSGRDWLQGGFRKAQG